MSFGLSSPQTAEVDAIEERLIDLAAIIKVAEHCPERPQESVSRDRATLPHPSITTDK